MIPLLEHLNAAQRVLIAGCGGGFDVYAGIPLGTYLAERGCQIIYANLSFSNLWDCGGTRIDPVTWLVNPQCKELPYFPEKWLSEWLQRRNLATAVYAFSKSGVRPLAAAYRNIIERHGIDQVVLVDGGTDSLIFGDEPGMGTIVEDAVSIVAACQAAGNNILLAAIGFGIDHFHGVSHHSFLENAAHLIRVGGYLGGFSLTKEMPEASAFLDLVDYANQRQPSHRSIVCNSIAGALRGEFGDHHATNRTGGSELFINPLMAQYWAFKAQSVVDCMAFGDALSHTDSLRDASRVIETEREYLDIRLRRSLPL